MIEKTITQHDFSGIQLRARLQAMMDSIDVSREYVALEMTEELKRSVDLKGATTILFMLEDDWIPTMWFRPLNQLVDVLR